MKEEEKDHSRVKKFVKKLHPFIKVDKQNPIKPSLAYYHEVMSKEHHPKDLANEKKADWLKENGYKKNLQDFINETLDTSLLKVEYLSPDQQEAIELHFNAKDNKIYRNKDNGSAYNTISHSDSARTIDGKVYQSDTPDYAAFVVRNGKMYAQHHISKIFQHTSITAGNSVSCAGLIKIVDGKISEIVNKSGHYQVSSETFRDFVKDLYKSHPNFFADEYKIKDKFRPLYFEPVLHSGSSVFIHKLGEQLNLSTSRDIIFSSVEEFINCKLPYKFELSEEKKIEKIKQSIAKSIAAEHGIKPEKNETKEDFFKKILSEHHDAKIDNIVTLSSKIIEINTVINNEVHDQKIYKELHEQLGRIFHLKLEILRGNDSLVNEEKNAINIFYERSLNKIENPELRENIKDKLFDLYNESKDSYVQREKNPSTNVKPITAVLCTEMPDLKLLETTMRDVIKQMKAAGHNAIANQFQELYDLREIKGKDFISAEEFKDKKSKLINNIMANPELSTFKCSEEGQNILNVPIFYTQQETVKIENTLLDSFSKQVEAIRVANLRHIAKKGESLDKTIKFNSYYSEGEEDHERRLNAAEEVINYSLTQEYLKNIITTTLDNCKNLKDNDEITIVRPIKDYSKKSNSYNFLTNMTSQILMSGLNKIAEEMGKKVKFVEGVTKMETTTNRTDADLIGRLIKQPYFSDSKDIRGKNIIIFDDHAQAGAFTTTLTNFANGEGGNVACVATLTCHPSSSNSLYANPKIVNQLKEFVRDEDNFGKPLSNQEAQKNLESLLNRQGLSMNNLTNAEALILSTLFLDKTKTEKLKELESIALEGIKIVDGQKDSLVKTLQEQEKPFTVRALTLEIEKRIKSGERIINPNKKQLDNLISDKNAINADVLNNTNLYKKPIESQLKR
jgi:hypothetical protein